MLRKAEFWKLPIQLAHDPVSSDFGDDARSGDRKRESIALYNRIVGKWEIPHRQTIDQAVVWWHGQGFHRTAHRQMSRSQDVETVDFSAVCCRHRPNDAGIFTQARVKSLSFRGRDFFGIIQTRTGETGRQNHGGGGHWTSQRPPSRLIHSCDPLQAAGMEGGFKGQIRHG